MTPPSSRRFNTLDYEVLNELCSWWLQRRALAASGPHKVEPKTYWIQQRFVSAIADEAQMTGETITRVINRALASYFIGREKAPKAPPRREAHDL